MKKNNQKKYKRLLLKLIWLGIILIIGIVGWFGLYALIWFIFKEKITEITTSISVTIGLLTIFIACYIVLRKSKKVLFRWMGKSLLLIAPFMVLCGVIMCLLLVKSKNHVLSPAQTQSSQQSEATIPESAEKTNEQNNSTITQPSEYCFDNYIPYNTIYQDTSTLYEGETEESVIAPNEGIERTCTNDGIVTTSIIKTKTDRLIYRGTKQRTDNSAGSNSSTYQYQSPTVTYPSTDNCHITDFFCD
ncbi:hypothetical protein KDA11_04095 [Candidatus Saccharibacteria bacterium]|nr:hypothetical protein [Candidatus Saccharibacteria bacterium]